MLFPSNYNDVFMSERKLLLAHLSCNKKFIGYGFLMISRRYSTSAFPLLAYFLFIEPFLCGPMSDETAVQQEFLRAAESAIFSLKLTQFEFN
jgi:hypothetical protein